MNIMFVGVGGQGTLLASRLVGKVLMSKGFDVKLSEVHGMAQRGGSVVTYVKYGEKVYSPVIEQGEADIIVAFEKCEAIRWISFLKEDGKMIINSQEIDPMPVIVGAAKYPSNIEETLDSIGVSYTMVDALELANKAGNVKSVNVVLMGILSKIMALGEESWLDAIRSTVPAKFLSVNLDAFTYGLNCK